MTPDRTIAQQEIEEHKKDKVSILQTACCHILTQEYALTSYAVADYNCAHYKC